MASTPSRSGVDEDGRIAVRHKIFEPAALTSASEELRVHLINISTTGALGHSINPLVEHSRWLLHVHDLSMTCEVVWCNLARFGLKFSTPLTSDDLSRILGDMS